MFTETAENLVHRQFDVTLVEMLDQVLAPLDQAVVFSLFVGAFKLIEHAIMGLWKGRGVTGGLVDFFEKGHHELLAGCLVTFVGFIPFFAFRELGRVLGECKIGDLFFRSRDDQ